MTIMTDRSQNIRSSYIPRQYGRLFKSLIYVLRPAVCVEFGILDGYSTIVIAYTLKRLNGGGHLYSYDLFEQYPYNHAIQDQIRARITRFGLDEYVTVSQGDVRDVWRAYQEHSVDFLHVDVSNTGDVLADVLLTWNSRLRDGGCIVFEGGSPFRDEISWMKENRKAKLHPVLKKNAILKKDYTFAVIHPYPSIVLCSKHVRASAQSLREWTAERDSVLAAHSPMDEGSLKQLLEEF
jgi:predicted O-methyltransferase YrrM